jgi:hypothetical protein
MVSFKQCYWLLPLRVEIALMSGKTKLHVKPSKKDLIYTCQYKVANTDGAERTCGDEVWYGSFRNHVIIQHLNGDTSKWNPDQYIHPVRLN